MHVSQQAFFELPSDSLGLDQEKEILDGMRGLLTNLGFFVDNTNAYRDMSGSEQLGWQLSIKNTRESLVIELTSYTLGWSTNPRGKLLCIAPQYIPGFFKRKFGGKKQSATPKTMYSIAHAIHMHLISNEFSNIVWAWDGEPNETDPNHPVPATIS